jgi:hypothetical protein
MLCQCEKYLEQYKTDSKPLNEFKSKLGQAIIGKSESDFGKFAIDEFDLAEKAFYSAGSVDQLIKTAGEKQAEQLARSFIASRIKSGSPKRIERTRENEIKSPVDISEPPLDLFHEERI